MEDELMTTRELQEFLRVDRTTIYSMLNEGRLPGFKVGGQWRFSRREITTWLQEQREEVEGASARPSPDTLPLAYIQPIQTVFAEAMRVGSIVTRLDGRPLTEISNSCAFCDLVQSTTEGSRRCTGSWRALAVQKERQPRLHRCHAGLLYARGPVKVENEFIAMVLAGQIVIEEDLEPIISGVDELALTCGLKPAQLRDTLDSVSSLTAERAEQLMGLLARMGEILSEIGGERMVLLRKLRHIAEVTAL